MLLNNRSSLWNDDDDGCNQLYQRDDRTALSFSKSSPDPDPDRQNHITGPGPVVFANWDVTQAHPLSLFCL